MSDASTRLTGSDNNRARGDDTDPSDGDDEELPSAAALRTRPARKRRSRRGAAAGTSFTPEALEETAALKQLIHERMNAISQEHKVTLSAIRQELGYSVEYGRQVSPYHRWAKWYAATEPNPAPRDLVERSRLIGAVWAALKADTSEYETTMAKVNEWHQTNTGNAVEYDAKRILAVVAKKARKLATSASNNDRVAMVVIAAHSHSRVEPAVIGTKQSLAQLAESLKGVEGLTHLRDNFHARVIQRPPANGSHTSIDFDDIPRGSGENRYDDRWQVVKRAVPLHLIRLITVALGSNDLECEQWAVRSHDGTQMVYQEIFDILAEVGLCFDGWPTECQDLLAPGSECSVDDGDTVVIISGSLEHWNMWPRHLGRLLYVALCEQSIRVRPMRDEE
ncbi:unnamed protein product [Tilletia laevis]|uniref:Uncharacterized protein n=2 Tax=Tilletia TaxID=13289 RepID=A0A177VGV6_9BASI|nr:hypothetical protein CF328_g6264 [Tilletia controversa]KAE8194911.1 hypothetical protein CF336_g3328 [Tilletia laevis]KAE8248399.1 hypothetical protein A4X03_0g6787 [Tilletia caries]KAE8207873.1 hypothetical protein CF335_g821 [Tilletia laevis]CAD6892782.1 unnamed protein product [Tilletia caries]